MQNAFFSYTPNKSTNRKNRAIFATERKTYRDESGTVRSRILLSPGFIEGLSAEQIRDISIGLTYRMEHKNHPELFSAEDQWSPIVSEYINRYWDTMVMQNKIDIDKNKDRKRIEKERNLSIADTLKNADAREIGAEWCYHQTLEKLQIPSFLKQQGWDDDFIKRVLSLLITRTVYRSSEYKSLQLMSETSAVCELYGLDASSWMDLSEKQIWNYYNLIRDIESSFRTLKLDLNLRPIYHQRDDATEAHISFGLLSFWIVNTIRVQLKHHNIRHDWTELVRIMMTQKTVTTSATNKLGKKVCIRNRTIPDQKLREVYGTLGIKQHPYKRKKIVVPKPNFKKKKIPDYGEVRTVKRKLGLKPRLDVCVTCGKLLPINSILRPVFGKSVSSIIRQRGFEVFSSLFFSTLRINCMVSLYDRLCQSIELSFIMR